MDLNDLLFRHQLAAMHQAGQIDCPARVDDDIGVLQDQILRRVARDGGTMQAPDFALAQRAA